MMAHLAKFGFEALTCQPPTLEELMLSHYGDELKAHHVRYTNAHAEQVSS
ncbi:hypothetical protein [Micrococcoides hystricis]|uniref:Uncharacterized protein n=1 Tax=Micrococcoides hystricis TaxID=1572761 RepID=A0ABV6PCV2_9MICC